MLYIFYHKSKFLSRMPTAELADAYHASLVNSLTLCESFILLSHTGKISGAVV